MLIIKLLYIRRKKRKKKSVYLKEHKSYGIDDCEYVLA